MSLDRYIAGPDDTGFDQLFKWYEHGDVVVPPTDPDLTFRTSPASAEHWAGIVESTGALVVGRELFDQTRGGVEPIPWVDLLSS